MTSIDLKLNLPAGLARDAEAAGLLSPGAVKRLLAEEVRRAAARRLAEGTEKVGAAGVPPLSLAEIQDEIGEARKGA